MGMDIVSWTRQRQTEYRGHIIGPGTIYERVDGGFTPIIIFYAPIGADKKELFELGKPIVDRLLDSAASGSSTTT